MNTTELIRPSAAERPTFGEMIAEVIPLVSAVAGYRAAQLVPVGSIRGAA